MKNLLNRKTWTRDALIILSIFTWLFTALGIIKIYFQWDRETFCEPMVKESIRGFINEVDREDCKKFDKIFSNTKECMTFKGTIGGDFHTNFIDWDMGAAVTLVCFKDHICYGIVLEDGFFRISCRNEVFKVLTVR